MNRQRFLDEQNKFSAKSLQRALATIAKQNFYPPLQQMQELVQRPDQIVATQRQLQENFMNRQRFLDEQNKFSAKSLQRALATIAKQNFYQPLQQMQESVQRLAQIDAPRRRLQKSIQQLCDFTPDFTPFDTIASLLSKFAPHDRDAKISRCHTADYLNFPPTFAHTNESATKTDVARLEAKIDELKTELSRLKKPPKFRRFH